ncbi:MAG: hypothetical protein AABZ47_11225 [Planctomycetota bacterium]
MTTEISKTQLLDLHRGFFRRARHLLRWTDLIHKRVEKLRPPKDLKGATFLFDFAHFFLTRSRNTLREISDTLEKLEVSLNQNQPSLKSISDQMWLLWRYKFDQVESNNHAIERHFHPVLAVRSKSDEAYDRFILKFLVEIGLPTIHPISVHKLIKQSSAAAVERFTLHDKLKLPPHQPKLGSNLEQKYGNVVFAIFYFFPSVRSLTSLTLLYHEVGHVFWEYVATRAERERLLMKMHQAFIPSCHDHLEKEIAADAFAALVGGYSFYATFCPFLLTKPEGWSSRTSGYLPPDQRMWITRHGTTLTRVSENDLGDSFFRAWDSLERLFRSQNNPKPLTRITMNGNKAIEFLKEFKEVLERHSVKLADKPREPNYNENGCPVLPSSKSDLRIRELFTTATYFRDKVDSAEEYIAWEERALALAGLRPPMKPPVHPGCGSGPPPRSG